MARGQEVGVGLFCPQGGRLQCLEMFLVVTTKGRGCYRHLVGRVWAVVPRSFQVMAGPPGLRTTGPSGEAG